MDSGEIERYPGKRKRWEPAKPGDSGEKGMTTALKGKSDFAGARESSGASAERRHTRRAKITQWVRVRPSDYKEDHFEEVRGTTSVSRKGLYFTSWRPCYYKGMRLFLTFPFSPDAPVLSSEYVGQVVRVDSLPGGLFGVGVQLVTPVGVKPSVPPSRFQQK